MTDSGLVLCTRFAIPPNLLHLCGPEKQNDLAWYAKTGKTDKGTEEIISRFSTLYPYVQFIARENGIRNPFSKKTIEAYWIGNNLLDTTVVSHFYTHLSDQISLKKKLGRKKFHALFENTASRNLIPHHSFHVLNIYRRTGNIDSAHTLATMDACLINWGKILEISKRYLTVSTQPLVYNNDTLCFGKPVNRNIILQEKNDAVKFDLSAGDYVSYHWGKFCTKLTPFQLKNLIKYTNISLKMANQKRD